MGEKGTKLSQQATTASEQVVQSLAAVGEVSSRKMFGGYGIFESGAMFALVNAQGEVFLKADGSNRSRFDEAGANQHGRMPYFQVPAAVLEDEIALQDWARTSIEIAHAGKKSE